MVAGKRIGLAGNVPVGDEHTNGKNEQNSEDIYCNVRVELKKLLLFLSADQTIPKRILANFVEGKLVHLFLIHDDVCIQYLLPAILE